MQYEGRMVCVLISANRKTKLCVSKTNLVLLLGCLTAGVTGKGGMWRTKPPDAESASWGRFPESAAERPHLSGARGVTKM
jgi:hypothetical protein